MNLCFSLHDTIEQHRSVFAHQDWCKHLVRVETVLCNEMQWMNSFVFSPVLPHFPDGHRLKISFFSLFLYRWAFRARNGAEINSQTPDMMLKIKEKQQLNPRMSFQWGTRSRRCDNKPFSQISLLFFFNYFSLSCDVVGLVFFVCFCFFLHLLQLHLYLHTPVRCKMRWESKSNPCRSLEQRVPMSAAVGLKREENQSMKITFFIYFYFVSLGKIR